MGLYEERVKLMARYIREEAARVIDLGAGDCDLLKYIPKNTTYIPIDIKYNINLNKNPEEILKYGRVNYVFCSGILEYIHNLERILKLISTIADNIILSYNPVREWDSTGLPLPPRDSKWVNAFTLKEIQILLKKYNYHINDECIIQYRPFEVILFAARTESGKPKRKAKTLRKKAISKRRQ